MKEGYPAAFRPAQSFGRDQHLAGVAAVVGADDAVLGHEVDEAAGAAVADAEGALQERRAAALLADDDLDGLLVDGVAGAELAR